MFETITRRLIAWYLLRRDIDRLRLIDRHLLDDMGIDREDLVASVKRRSQN